MLYGNSNTYAYISYRYKRISVFKENFVIISARIINQIWSVKEEIMTTKGLVTFIG